MFTFANLAMRVARIINIVLTTAMILCFIINEINIIVMGFYSMEIHNASIYFTLFNIASAILHVRIESSVKEDISVNKGVLLSNIIVLSILLLIVLFFLASISKTSYKESHCVYSLFCYLSLSIMFWGFLPISQIIIPPE